MGNIFLIILHLRQLKRNRNGTRYFVSINTKNKRYRRVENLPFKSQFKRIVKFFLHLFTQKKVSGAYNEFIVYASQQMPKDKGKNLRLIVLFCTCQSRLLLESRPLIFVNRLTYKSLEMDGKGFFHERRLRFVGVILGYKVKTTILN